MRSKPDLETGKIPVALLIEAKRSIAYGVICACG
jgi:hypothetical protein